MTRRPLTAKRLSVVAAWLPLIFVVSLMASCSGVQRTPRATATPAPAPTSSPTRPPSPTDSSTPPPTHTLTPSATPQPTETPTPTLTPTPLHPSSIAFMRQQSYPGSDILIEETLAPGANYDRYVASYRSEGLKIYGLLTLPQGNPPENGWPIILFNHGYIPPDQYRTTERYVAYQDAFARSGYISFKSDYRGHGDSEGDARGWARAPDYTIDVLNAVASLQRLPEADPHRVGMWGHSMGGSITLRAMVVTDDIQAGVIWAGVVATYEEVWAERPRWVAGRELPTPDGESTALPPDDGLFAYGTFDENPEFWAAIDPVTYLTDLSGPVQLHHATGDQSVPVEFSENLYVRLQEAGLPGELYVYQGDDHNISANFGTAIQRSLAFFEQHVKGAPDP